MNEITDVQAKFKLLCEPKTKSQWLNSAINCLVHQISATEEAWNNENWQIIVGDLYPWSPITNIAQEVKFKKHMKWRKNFMFNDDYGLLGGNLSGLSDWILLQTKCENRFVLNIIKNYYIPWIYPDEILQGDGILTENCSCREMYAIK